MPALAVSAPVFSPLSALPEYTEMFGALQDEFGLSVRDSQLELARIVRDTTARKAAISCIEAPTGTGKTLGYLAGALDAQAHAAQPQPIVVATATVGLQSQIMTHDVPRLEAIGALEPGKVVVAKGRGRYFCPRTAELLEDKKHQDTQLDFFDESKEKAVKGVAVSLNMLHAWKEGAWDGDRDTWSQEIPDCWDTYCAASNQTCVKRACEHMNKCPYMKSRAQMSSAQLIIANHDLVLADLALRANEDAEHTVLPVKSYSLIVDEAHNLPDKAVGLKRARAKLAQTQWLHDLAPYGEVTLGIKEFSRAIAKLEGVSGDVFGAVAATLACDMEVFNGKLAKQLRFDHGGVHNWGFTAPDACLVKQGYELSVKSGAICRALERAAKCWSERAQTAIGVEKGLSLRMLMDTFRFLKQSQDLHAGLEAFCGSELLVRWAKRDKEGNIQLNAQPLEGEGVLAELLWKTEIPVTMVSATLQVAGSFERFGKKVGLPARASTHILPAVFDYSRGMLHQPKMRCEPGMEGYEAEVTHKLKLLFDAKVAAGTLVLFTARETMERVAKALRSQPEIGECLLVQGTAPLPELVKWHKARIDAGQRSVLMGLNSMSEGLDLPGDYCNHVVVTRLPFALPHDPVEATRRLAMGSDWFPKAYLADMLTALIQACGRLVRREIDHGVITVLDKRMQTKGYATQAVAALPGFTRSATIRTYFELAKERGFTLDTVAQKRETGSALPSSITPKSGLTLASRVAANCPEAAMEVSTVSHIQACSYVANDASFAPKPEVEKKSWDASASIWARLEKLVKASSQSAVRALPKQIPAWNLYPVLAELASSSSGIFAQTEDDIPFAVLLGIRLQNKGCLEETAPAWQKFLSLRPDLLHLVWVLRDRLDGAHNPSFPELDAAGCREKLSAGLDDFGVPDDEALLKFFSRAEQEVHELMSADFKLPNVALALGMRFTATCLEREAKAAQALEEQDTCVRLGLRID